MAIDRNDRPVSDVIVRYMPATALRIVTGPVDDQGEPAGIRAIEALKLGGPQCHAVFNGPMWHDGVHGNHFHPMGRMFDRGFGMAFNGSLGVLNSCTLSVAKGVALVSHVWSPREGADVAVQLYPEMILDGVPQDNSQGNFGDYVWRSAAGVMEDGRVGWYMCRGPIRAMGVAMRRAGFIGAGYLDGGGSSSLLVRGAERLGNTENRRTPSWLAEIPVGALGGSSGLVVAGVVAGVVGLALGFGVRHFRGK